MKNYKKYLPYFFIILLFLVLFYIWHFLYLNNHKGNILKVAFLDVGQGDAIYIEAPNGKQMLIDSGPGPVVLSKLASVMPFADRTLDVVAVTNPDKDHIGGFIDILKNYKVNMILEPGTKPNTTDYKDLEQSIVNHKVTEKLATRGMRIVLDKDKNIYFDVLFPDRDVSTWSTNDGSLVGKLSYGQESFMLMGDASKYTELLIYQNEDKNTLSSQVLKLGHHGSHTSSSLLWLEAVHPSIAVISAGLNNKYGHPHQDILERLKSLKIPYVGTYQKGTIIFTTDGQTMSY